MANTSTITSGDSNILIIGDSGTYKTRFLATIPNIYVFDFDKGMASARDRAVEYDTFRDAPRGQKPLKGSGLFQFGFGWKEFIKKLNEIGARIEAGKGPQVIGLDSLTFMSELAMNDVLVTTDQKSPHQGSYGAQQQYLKQVLGELTAWPVRLVATAHIQRDTNDITQVQEKLPLLTGKLAGLISAYFDEVYFTDTSDGPRFLTKGNPSMRQAKSRWNVPDKTKMDWAELSKFLPDLAGAKTEHTNVAPSPLPEGAKPQSVIKL